MYSIFLCPICESKGRIVRADYEGNKDGKTWDIHCPNHDVINYIGNINLSYLHNKSNKARKILLTAVKDYFAYKLLSFGHRLGSIAATAKELVR